MYSKEYLSMSISSLDKTYQKTNEWLTELADTTIFNGNKERAYTALRAVLHAIRDRVLPEQAAHFAAEFPVLLKGIYFDNWSLSTTPTKERTKAGFLAHIALELRHALLDIDPQEAFRAVFRWLSRKISAGALENVKQQLPHEVRELIDAALSSKGAEGEENVFF
jgi:uncharacterized protein (DUF2267 family)